MQLVEVKDDIAKILYSPDRNHILPSDFLLINDVNQKLISQIINIETSDKAEQNLAVLRLVLSIDNEDNLSLYNGYIPSKNSSVHYINPDEILDLIKGNGESIFWGELANHPSCFAKTAINFLNEKLYIQSDRDDKTRILIQNLIYELSRKGKKLLLIDFDGRYSNLSDTLTLKLSEGFRFPLNSEGLDNISEYDLNDCPLDDKAVIQSIILELKEYMQTVSDKYIPFTVFKNAVDDVFLSNPISGLMLLRNRLWRYSQNKIFAEKKSDFQSINTAMQTTSAIVLDLSELDECWYKYALQTIVNLTLPHCYILLSLDGIELDKKTVISLYKKDNIIPVVCSSYKSKYSQMLKSICSNQLLCRSSCLYSENEKYSEFLNKLNTSSIILYGESTFYLPLLVNLKLFNSKTADDVIENEIKRDVDKLLTSSKGIISSDIVAENIALKQESTGIDLLKAEEYNDDVLDSDLDFLDEIFNTENNLEVNNASQKSENNINQPVEVKLPDNDYTVFSPVENSNNENAVSDVVDNTDEFKQEIVHSVDNVLNNDPVPEQMNEIIEVAENDEEIIHQDEDISIQMIQEEQPNTEQKSEEVVVQHEAQVSSIDNEVNEYENKPEQTGSIDKTEIVKEQIDSDNDIEPLTSDDNDIEAVAEHDDNLESEIVSEEEEIHSIDDIIEQVTSERKIESNEAQIIQDNSDQVIKENDEDNIIEEEQISEEDEIQEIEDEGEDEISSQEELIDYIDEPNAEKNANIEEDEEEYSDDLSKDMGIRYLKDHVNNQNNKVVATSIDKLYANTSNTNVMEELEEKIAKSKQSLRRRYRIGKNKEAVEKFIHPVIAKEEKVKTEIVSQKQNKEVEVKKKPVEKPKIKEEINTKKTTKLPVYETTTSYQFSAEDIPFNVGDKVFHPKHGRGVIVGFTNYSNKILFCQIEFENVGRRILDPRIAGIEKINE